MPIGVYVGLRPALAERVQPLAQFLAAFPANVLFPFVVVGIVTYHLNPDIWLSPLIVLGTQWYILFNVIAGASVFPERFEGSLQHSTAEELAVVAQSDLAWDISLLCDRRADRFGRVVERQHRRGGCELGATQSSKRAASALISPRQPRRGIIIASCSA